MDTLIAIVATVADHGIVILLKTWKEGWEGQLPLLRDQHESLLGWASYMSWYARAISSVVRIESLEKRCL